LIAVIPARKNSKRFPGKNWPTDNVESYFDPAYASAIEPKIK